MNSLPTEESISLRMELGAFIDDFVKKHEINLDVVLDALAFNFIVGLQQASELDKQLEKVDLLCSFLKDTLREIHESELYSL